MTKTIKKGLLAILLFGLLVAGAFSVLSFRTASAAWDDEEKANFAQNVQAIYDMANTDDIEGFTVDEVRAVVGNNGADLKFQQLYNAASNNGLKAIDDDLVAKYETIFAAYNLNKAVDLYSGVAAYCKSVIDKDTGYSYTASHAYVEEYRALYNAIRTAGGEDMAYLHSVITAAGAWTTEGDDLPVLKNLVDAEAQIAEWQQCIQDAIDAINAIQVRIFENEVYEMVYLSAAIAGEKNYKFVLDSSETVDTALEEYEKVSDEDKVSVTNSALLKDSVTGAEKAIKDLNAKVQAVIDEVNGIYNDPTKYHVVNEKPEICWSSKDAIELAESHLYGNDDVTPAIEGLDNSDFNNLRAAAEGKIGNKLQEMLGNLEIVGAAIFDVNEKINAIGTVYYTTNSNGLIKTAEDAFKALPSDVKNHDSAEVAPTTYYVANYTKMTAARKTFNDFQAQVDALVDAISGLPAVEADSAVITKYNAVIKLIDKISEDAANKDYQLNGDKDTLTGAFASALNDKIASPESVAKYATVYDAYEYFEKLVNKINTTAKPIREKIEGLGPVELSDTFDSDINTITNMLKENAIIDRESLAVKDERYISAIGETVYAEYLTKRGVYESLSGLVETWLDKVAKIEFVSVNTFDVVKEAETAFNNIINNNLSDDDNIDDNILKQYDANLLKADLSEINTEYNNKAIKLYYETYAYATGKKAAIIYDLETVKQNANALKDTRPDVNGDYAGYANTVKEKVTDLLDAFATKTYGEGTNATNYDDTSVEGYITTAKYFETYAPEAYAIYADALLNVKANAIEAKINDITAKSTESSNLIKTARDAYGSEPVEGAQPTDVQAKVRNHSDLVNVENKLNTWISNVNKLLEKANFDGNDAVAADIVVAAVETDEQLKAGVYKINVTTATTLRSNYNGFTNVEKAYTNIADTDTLLNNIYTVAGGKSGELGYKLAYIDAELGKYVLAYNNGSPEEGRYNALVDILDKLDTTQKVLLTNFNDFEQIARDNDMAEALANAIVNLYVNIQEGVDVKDLVVYNLISSIYQNLNGSQKKLVNENVAKLSTAAGLDEPASLAAIDVKVNGTQEQPVVPDTIEDIINKAIADSIKENGNVEKAILKAIADSIKDNGNVKDAILDAIADSIKENGNVEKAILKAIADSIAEDGNVRAAIDAAVKAEKEAREAAVKAEKEAREAADKSEKDAREAADAALDAKVDAEKDAREAADKAEKDAREATDKETSEKVDSAVANLQEQIDSLKNKTTIIIIAFAAVCVILSACVIILFIKRK